MGDELLHEYDAAKRREYYLRTRKLKGRRPAATKKTAIRVRKASKVGPPKKTRQQRQEERRRKLEAQINALKERLKQLREVLSKLTAEAKARSGQKDTKKSAAKKTSKNEKPKQTAKQKADAAKRSKEYYEKHKDEILAEEVKSLTAKIKTIQERIAKMRKDGSVGAQRKTTK